MTTPQTYTRRYQFLEREVDEARTCLDAHHHTAKWLAPTLALAHFRKKRPGEVAGIIRQALSGAIHAWSNLQAEYGVNFGRLNGTVHTSARLGTPEFRDERDVQEATAALYEFLVKEYELDKPGPEDRIATLEREVATLKAQIAGSVR